MIRNLLAAIGLCVVLLAGAAGLYANNWGPFDDRPRRLAVSFAGLDLSTEAGQDLLDRRIKLAINAVCGRETDYRNLKAAADESRCRRDARAGAEPQIFAAIDAAHGRRRMAEERAQQIAAATPPRVPAYETQPPSAFANPPYAPVAASDMPPLPPTYAAPVAHPATTTVVRRYTRPKVIWVRTKNGLVRKVIYRKVYRRTVQTVSTTS